MLYLMIMLTLSGLALLLLRKNLQAKKIPVIAVKNKVPPHVNANR